MDIELLKSTIERQEQSALGYLNGDLAQSRADSYKAYLSEPYGNEQEGRSQVITSDVADVIEGVLPGLIRVFTSGDEIVEFEAFGPEDEEAAKQETDVCNYYLTQSNNFLPFLQTWLRDGLISKNGYVKLIWEDDEYLDTETYHSLSDEEIAYILQTPELEVVEQEQREDGWYVKLQKVVKKGKPKLYNCPPETILVNSDHTEVSLRNAKFVQHRVKMTLSEIREMGYKVDDDITTHEPTGYEEESRNRWEDEWWTEETDDPASKVVTFKESYIRIDLNGDGITELRKVCMVGRTVLANEEVDEIPVCAWTPTILPHRHIGRSLAEQTEDIQLIKTTLLRQALDNMYLSNNGRWAISDQVNLDDMLVSRPGGVVRLHDGARPGEGHIMPLVPPALAGQAFPMMEYMDGMRETRTGITRYNQGLDANSLNKTATGINAIMSAAQARIELIARSFAETGLRDLMFLLHGLVRKHSDKEMVVRLRNKWVQVDPRDWKTRFDMTISVGLGTGNREQQMQNLMNIMMVQEKAFAIGAASPQNIYNSAAKLTEIAGFKAPEQFFTPPQPKPPQPTPEQVKAQADMQKAQMDIQAERERMAMEQQRFREQQELEMEQFREKMAAELYQFNVKLAAEMEMKEKTAGMDYDLAESKLMLEAQKPEPGEEVEGGEKKRITKLEKTLANMLEQHTAMLADIMTRPKRVVRGEDGRVVGVESV